MELLVEDGIAQIGAFQRENRNLSIFSSHEGIVEAEQIVALLTAGTLMNTRNTWWGVHMLSCKVEIGSSFAGVMCVQGGLWQKRNLTFYFLCLQRLFSLHASELLWNRYAYMCGGVF